MLARHEGQIVFVAGAIPGERVRARVERVSKQLAFAVTAEVLEASPDRRGIDIDWACGGSLYAHIAYPRQVQLKSELVADAFARIGKLALDRPVSVMASDEHGYRMRARLHAWTALLDFSARAHMSSARQPLRGSCFQKQWRPWIGSAR